MELGQIEIFLAAADCGSFSGAAERLYVTHSTVSRTIQALEGELETRLFIRGSRGVSLTPAGARLRTGGAQLLESAAALVENVRKKGEEICGNTED